MPELLMQKETRFPKYYFDPPHPGPLPPLGGEGSQERASQQKFSLLKRNELAAGS
jgi:hypothetical protein